MTYFVLADVHSFYEEMMKALKEKGFDITNKEHHVIILGDLFDRGPDSKKCLSFVKLLNAAGRLVYIRGNHEDLLIQCIEECKKYINPDSCHFDNGTIKTLSQLLDIPAMDLMLGIYDKQKFEESTNKIIEFIENNTVDFYELNNHIFVHGWIPVKINKKTSSPYKNFDFDENWREGDWEEARWINGMRAWDNGIFIRNKTIVCGHWHASWGRAHITHEYPEFPKKSEEDNKVAFSPFIAKGIIAMDSCVVHTKFLNCIKIEEND